MRSLSVLAVSATGESLYRQVLRSQPLPLTAHAAELGLGVDEADAELQRLIALKLVRQTGDGIIMAEPPGSVLEPLLDVEEATLSTRRQELTDARASIRQLAADFRHGRSSGAQAAPPAVESVSQEAGTSLVTAALRAATGPIRSSVCGRARLPDLDEELRQARQAAAAAGGRLQRTLYAPSVLDHPLSQEVVAAWADLGVQQRVASDRLTDFIAFDDTLVVTTAEWGSSASEASVVRDPMLVSAFVCLFDHAWAMALPLRHTRQPTPERMLLSLLASGQKDASIARHLGWGVRTVRRRVASIMADLGVETRFQLGAAAERTGLLAAAPADPPTAR